MPRRIVEYKIEIINQYIQNNYTEKEKLKTKGALLKIARKMIKCNLDIETISKCTESNKNEIRKLKRSMIIISLHL